ncbi:Beta-ketoacyl synthase [Cordyceps militaris CM01]|uniref:Highly reducing polyketide synthase milA n=1 Tax=Cordyceps militaris (strain CM01) TaxID=983644 RepID=MILA_CORMM|nr:Beta-ketoacyl synthase [Cordyceps militaris CM01]G3JUI8.1 RecName: Full=Highly reducing polyketide synthase milA; Short=HR-PKS milA; AltName: Full=Cordypyrones biosynthesis cluster protein A [Cordyceps militaris CM01]EGX87724.1 Beta-ketoacyl synthase [Cordyceps militaris CM01]
MEPIAIVGSACRFPGDATSPSKLWELLKAPRDLSQEVKRFNAKGFYHENGHHHGASNVMAAYTLESDPMEFDPQFFNIQPGEAESMDPQHRLLLETTYEGLEQAGIPIESLRGSDTSAFIGVMSADYTTMVFFDSECTPTYSATGTSRAILSNRLSHAFDWRGASMTLDTACSSSLVAIHLAVRELRSGSSRVAVAGGTNLILSADPFISETNLDMLSPQGKCHMWDARANGYARGEGISVVVLKTLRDALADGDHIECIIRETGVNQDGHTPGITMPNPEAQTRLIRDVYSRAGLDLSKPEDRCQYFEAHGTGTKAGDKVESRAIHDAFFPETGGEQAPLEPLYVGSVKTIIGHTEGTAGVAGVLRASLAIQNGTIPPNLHFESLNPELKPYYGNLQIATEAIPWPELHGGVRRASVNSFGFGGANCHVILEGYLPSYGDDALREVVSKPSLSSSPSLSPTSTSPPTPRTPANSLPFLISASSEKTLRKLVQRYIDHVGQNPNVDMGNLAWTLFKNRSALNFRLAVPAPTPEALITTLESVLKQPAGGPKSSIIRTVSQPKRLLGVFTGQGAQWATMGRQLVQKSARAAATVDRLDAALAALPDPYRPTWSLKAQILAEKKASRIDESAVSQPLCTVIQIILVDLLRNAGVDFDGVLGHSSGEIAAAYAAGFLSAEDAVKIAYTRGLCAHLARGQQGEKGGMIAAGMTHPDAKDLCENEAVLGRISVAAYNSPTSVTLSGDSDVIDQVSVVLEDEDKFNRVLRVQTAYHSHHMEACVGLYRKALAACNITVLNPAQHVPWFSSVYGGSVMSATSNIASEYWIQNMVQPVLFSEAVAAASQTEHQDALPTLAEIGPHPALKSPVLETLKSLGIDKVAYCGTLSRAVDDVDALSAFFGWFWSVSAQSGLQLDRYAAQFSQNKLVSLRNLPSYPWDHTHSYEFESRESHAHRFRELPCHPLLGVRTNTCGDAEYRWKNFLSTEEIPWLTGHQIQGQTLVPAAMFLIMAAEAATIAAGSLGLQVRLIELHDSTIHRALALDDDKSTETLFYLSGVEVTSSPNEGSILSATYHCDAATSKSSSRLTSIASGKVQLFVGGDASRTLPNSALGSGQLNEIDVDTFYDNLRTIGYNYNGAFRSIASLQRTTNWANGTIAAPTSTDPATSPSWVPLHPAVLDVSFQAVFAALSYPGDGRLQTLHVPTTIKRLTISPAALSSGAIPAGGFAFNAVSYMLDRRTICGDIEVGIAGQEESIFKVEGLTVSPVAPVTADDDKHMFADMVLCVAEPSTALLPDVPEQLLANTLSQNYGEAENAVSNKHSSLENGHLTNGHCLANGGHSTNGLTNGHASTNGHGSTNGHISTNGHSTNGDVLTNGHSVNGHAHSNGHSENGAISVNKPTAGGYTADKARSYHIVAGLLKQITDRYPKARILERVTDNASEVLNVFTAIGGRLSSYALDGIAESEFDAIADSRDDGSSLKRVSLQLESPSFLETNAGGEYDVVVLRDGHATDKGTLQLLRHLLRPGGYLLLIHELDQSLASLEGDSELWSGRFTEAGFSKMEAQGSSKSGRFSIMATMATNDAVDALRQPMVSVGAKIPTLIIIGGETPVTVDLIGKIRALLAPFCQVVQTVKSLAHLDDSAVAEKAFVLSLTELDSDLYRDLSEKTFTKLQELTTRSDRLIWVVSGSQGRNPYANMIKGTLRCLIEECSHLVTQILDIEDNVSGAGQFISDAVLRLHNLHSMENASKTLWSHEPELHLRNGQPFISRYLPNKQLDLGYNSLQRHVQVELQPTAGVLQLSADKSALSLERLRVAALPSSHLAANELETEIIVRYSQSVAVHVPALGYLYPVTGTDVQTGRVVAALSTENRSRVSVHKATLVPLIGLSDDQERSLPERLQAFFLAATIMQRCPPFTSAVVHEASNSLTQLLVDAGRKSGVQFIFTTSDASRVDEIQEQGWKFIARHGSTRQLSKLVQPDTLMCVDCTQTGSGDSLAAMGLQVPSGVAVLTASDFVRPQSFKYRKIEDQAVHEALKAAVAETTSLAAEKSDLGADGMIQIQDLPQSFAFGVPAKTISWVNELPVRATVLPALEECHFNPDRTYFLVGMAGSLGLSTVSYMISRGARHFALSSRNPQVDAAWIAAQRTKYGAVVNTFALDITDKAALTKTIAAIRATMPPIGGVANGALIIEDSLFADLTYKQMTRALGPKVDGSRYLDEAFGQDDLEFFILYSSLVSIAGNTGQIAYAVANSFMVSLAHQRRQRGLAASVINLTGVSGIGFITRTGHNIIARSKALGYDIISESDYCYIFAESVLASPSTSPHGPEVSSSLRYVDVARDKVVPPWAYDAKFGHYLLDRQAPATNGAAGESDNGGHLSLDVLKAAPPAECYDMIFRAFQTVLQKLLRLPADQPVPAEVQILDLGVDSLVAVKMRQWFLKELQVNMPVMKLIGGATVSQVVWSVVHQILPESAK